MTNKEQIAIQFKNVSLTIDDRKILHNINGTFYKQRITTLVGPSGAGKSTLLKLCNGLLTPTSGDILIEERSIFSYEPTELRRHVGIALQNAPMVKGTVFDNLALPLTLQDKTLPETEATEMLERVALESEHLYRDVDDLSGGQRQKVSIARTLINRPKILLLDEITSALDIHSVEEIEQLIVRIRDKFGVTIIWITHDLEQAKKVGDDAWILADGKLIEAGSSDILTNPKTDIAKQFISGGIV